MHAWLVYREIGLREKKVFNALKERGVPWHGKEKNSLEGITANTSSTLRLTDFEADKCA